MSKKLCKLVTSIMVSLLFSACAVGSTANLVPQSHFAFPNSNVKPIGPAKGEATEWSIFFPSNVTGDMEQKAYQKALEGTGGDLLVDIVSYSVTKIIPIPYIPLYYTTLYVEGIAAKMEVGKQKLK